MKPKVAAPIPLIDNPAFMKEFMDPEQLKNPKATPAALAKFEIFKKLHTPKAFDCENCGRVVTIGYSGFFILKAKNKRILHKTCSEGCAEAVHNRLALQLGAM